MERDEDLKAVRAYHERTKHGFRGFAASPGYLDWATQPDPFRRYDGCLLVRLPLPATGDPLPYARLFARGAEQVPARPVDLAAISHFFRYALSLTAWKRIPGAEWSLRANPSSGNLHPTEGYAVLPAIGGLGDRPAVYHYAPRVHGLERRAVLDDDAWRALTARFPAGSFLVGLASIHWREAWKYGERAYRYCQHDAGHALGTLAIAAASLGWRLRLLDRVGDDVIASLLGLDRDPDYAAADGRPAEREAPDLLAVVATVNGPEIDAATAGAAIDRTAAGSTPAAACRGRANRLSAEHVADWPIIDEVAAAAHHRPPPEVAGAEDFAGFPTAAEIDRSEPSESGRTAEEVILGRRSAVAMDGRTSISRAAFYRMLARVMPQRHNAAMPLDAIPWRPRIHLGLFVHRVDGLPPGLYALARDPAKVDLLRAAMGPDLAWERPAACPPGLPLFLLEEGDYSGVAARVSCDQDIAGDGAFSLGMLAEIADGLARFGPSFYRRLHWEAGLVGQILYLEAEESGVRATGIGCYFDDPVREVFGLAGTDIQSLYHFTVGGPVEDQRLTTLPAYG